MVVNKNLDELEINIGYKFQDINLLKLALTHSSMAHERVLGRQEYNERIEFLGDAVLELVSSLFLYKRYPEKNEGMLSKQRASLVCEVSLAESARRIKLGDFIMLGTGENKTGGRFRDSILSDAFEAVIGAIFLDGGLNEAEKFVLKYVLDDVENKTAFLDSKTTLQELVQKQYKLQVRYEIVSEEGPDHDKHFVARAFMGDTPLADGEGHTKKSAEQQAAFLSLKEIKL